jgi:aspartate 1-decarboxylase
MLKSKIHRCRVTGKDINYEGSITLDPDLMDAAGIVPYEKVDIYDIDNGNRFTTYTIEGERGSGDVILNGAAARLVEKGDLLIIVAYTFVDNEGDARTHKPSVVLVDENNRIKE